MKNVVILNACGMKNIGDAAICSVALSMIDEILEKKGIIYGMFTDTKEDITKYKIKSKLVALSSPYGMAININSDEKQITTDKKLMRFIKIISISFVLLFSKSFTPQNYRYIEKIRKADVVIGMGGGYLRTKEKYKDFFGLILTLLPLYIAKFYKKPILFLPISFGNFASTLHERIATHAMKGTTILCRDMTTYQTLKRYNTSVRFIPDLALFYDVIKDVDSEKKYNNRLLVLTAREWLRKENQQYYEKALTKLIKHAWKKYHLRTSFVAMAGNANEDDDKKVAQRIDQLINNKKIFYITHLTTPKAVQKLLDSAKVAICTRMHSAILASTVSTPFITIGYEHKTKGFMKHMHLRQWHTDIGTVDSNVLIRKLDRLLTKKNYNIFIDTLLQRQKEIYPYKEDIKQELRQTFAL